MLPLIAAFVIADDLSSDARLDTPITFAEKYLPLESFALRLKTATKAGIQIDARLDDRKLALFVEDRPAAETMERAADALRARWTRFDSGWKLEANPADAQAEAEAAQSEAKEERRALADWVQKASLPPSNGKDMLAAKTARLLREVGTLKATDLLLSGASIMGTGDGRGRSLRIPMEDTFEGFNVTTSDGPLRATNGLLVLRRDTTTGRVVQTVRTLGVGKNGTGIFGWADPMQDIRTESEVDRLDNAWAKTGSPLPEIKLKTPPLSEDRYGVGVGSLADVLARLHERSGLPVIAESFRIPAAYWGDPKGSTVAELLGAVLEDPNTKYGLGAPFVWKNHGGWLVARTPRAWNLRKGEIPESRLVPLEKKGILSLDDYASLAASLTLAQRGGLPKFRPLASFSTAPLRKGYWGLMVYDALPPKLRKLTPEGISLADLPDKARDRWREAVLGIMDTVAIPETWVDAVLKDVIPADAGFLVREENYDAQGSEISLKQSPPGTYRAYKSWNFRFGAGEKTVEIHAPTIPLTSPR